MSAFLRSWSAMQLWSPASESVEARRLKAPASRGCPKLIQHLFPHANLPLALSNKRPGVHTELSGDRAGVLGHVTVTWDRRLSTAPPDPAKVGSADVRQP